MEDWGLSARQQSVVPRAGGRSCEGEALLKGDQAGPRGDAAKSPARFEADLAGGGRTSGTQS
jgi:hypothetical protein